MPEVALCPVELSNVALRMVPRMHQNMQLRDPKNKKNSGEGLCHCNGTVGQQTRLLNVLNAKC